MSSGKTLLTGTTGFLGVRLLAALLGDGVNCVALARDGKTTAALRVRAALDELGSPARDVPVIACDLRDRKPSGHDDITRIVHVAASTRFNFDASNEPFATNVAGTRNLLAFATDRGVRDFHYVSTAYVSASVKTSFEKPASKSSTPRNAYERSKRDAEQLALDWAAADSSRSLTIYRPSIIVGEFADGRSEKFDGFYIAIRAFELLAKRRGRLAGAPIRIEGSDSGHQNIVPIDWVTKTIVAVLKSPAHHGRIYHLTNPYPPANLLIRSVMGQHFGLGAMTIVEKLHSATEAEQIFSDAASTIRPYMVESPQFDRSNTEEIERLTGQACPTYESAALSRLVSYATATRYGQRPASPLSRDDRAFCTTFFERFLPVRIAQSRVAIAAAMTVVVRFSIDLDDWTCRFIHGRLANISRATDPAEDFAYTLSANGFFEVLSASRPPQDLFFTGEATITGDVERALKMIMIFEAFLREFPCTHQSLAELQVAS